MSRSPSLPIAVLAAGAFLALALAAMGQEYRLDARAEPLSQAVRLRLDPAEAAYTGSVSVEVRLHRASDALLFHAEEIELERVLLRRAGAPEPWTLAPEVGEWGTITARAGETLAPGDYTLEIWQSHLAKLAVEMTPPLLAALERYFGWPYPYAGAPSATGLRRAGASSAGPRASGRGPPGGPPRSGSRRRGPSPARRRAASACPASGHRQPPDSPGLKP
jgi:hypothetical protein